MLPLPYTATLYPDIQSRGQTRFFGVMGCTLSNCIEFLHTLSVTNLSTVRKKNYTSIPHYSSDLESGTSYGGGLYSGMSSASKPHNLEECETIIKQLRAKNEQQAHELHRIKADLRDVLYSHKWTPDAFLLARAYVSEDSNEQR